MSQATRDALDSIHVRHVSQAKEYEDFKQLPKFNHVPLAVIHPTNRRKMREPVRPTPDMEKEIEVSPLRLKNRPKAYEIPESLQYSHGFQPGTAPDNSRQRRRPKSVSVHFGGSTGRFGGPSSARIAERNRGRNRSEAQRAEEDAEKAKQANKNLTVLMNAVKNQLKGTDSEPFHKTLGDNMTKSVATAHMEQKKLFRKIFEK